MGGIFRKGGGEPPLQIPLFLEIGERVTHPTNSIFRGGWPPALESSQQKYHTLLPPPDNLLVGWGRCCSKIQIKRSKMGKEDFKLDFL